MNPFLPLLTGGLALAARYLLILAAGWLAARGLALYDEAAGTLTLHIESVVAALAAGAAFVAALAWRIVAKRLGGKT